MWPRFVLSPNDWAIKYSYGDVDVPACFLRHRVRDQSGMNRSRPSRYLLAQEQYCGGEKCNHESRLPSNQQPVAGAGISAFEIPERVYQDWRPRKVPRPSRPLWIASSSKVSYSKLLRSISQILNCTVLFLSTRFNRQFCRRACGQVREH